MCVVCPTSVASAHANRRVLTGEALVVFAVVAFLSGSVVPNRLQAQASVSIAAGAAVPLGSIADSARTGYVVGGGIEFAVPNQPFSIRARIAFAQFQANRTRSTSPIGMTASGSPAPNLASVAGDLTWRFSGPRLVTPYVLVGVGLYHFGGSPVLVAHDNETKVGVAGGLGVESVVGGLRLFVEGRLERVARVQVLPVIVGVKF